MNSSSTEFCTYQQAYPNTHESKFYPGMCLADFQKIRQELIRGLEFDPVRDFTSRRSHAFPQRVPILFDQKTSPEAETIHRRAVLETILELITEHPECVFVFHQGAIFYLPEDRGFGQRLVPTSQIWMSAFDYGYNVNFDPEIIREVYHAYHLADEFEYFYADAIQNYRPPSRCRDLVERMYLELSQVQWKVVALTALTVSVANTLMARMF